MRPATADDRDTIERLVAARFDWMAVQGHTPWPETPGDVADKAGRAPMWCLVDGCELCGLTILVDRLGTAAWTETERQEPSLLLASTITDPVRAGQQLGARIAWWAVDRAARLGYAWVRLVTSEPALADYYRRQGFDLVRERTFRGKPVYALQRPAQLLPEPLSA
jgi:GNAT superfamily N-acetyltransferase